MTACELRRWRDRHRLTQAQAAVWLCVSERQVGRWETGACAVPAHVERLCGCWSLLAPERRRALWQQIAGIMRQP